MPISPNFRAFLNTVSDSCRTLPIVILYVTEACNLQCITCSYRRALPNELSIEEITKLAKVLEHHGLQNIVYSGGEPLVRFEFPEICRIFSELDMPPKQTLLTNGLLLDKRYDEIQQYLREIIVSIDGADAQTHDKIRGVRSFDQILNGVRGVANSPSRHKIAIRTVLQKGNFRQVKDMVRLAKTLSVSRISFLSADILSNGFGRDTRGSVASNENIILNANESAEFRRLIEQMVTEFRTEFDNRFISESPEKMFHIVQYYEALIGTAPFPRNRCNAPMVSAVITASGNIQPCFFLPKYGNVREKSMHELLNCPEIRSTRQEVRLYSLERCKTCVCTLNVPPLAALLNRF